MLLRTLKSLVYTALQWGTTERRRRERNPNRSSHLERSDRTEWWHTCAVHGLGMPCLNPCTLRSLWRHLVGLINLLSELILIQHYPLDIHSFFFCSTGGDKYFFRSVLCSLAGPWNKMKGGDWLVILIDTTHIISAPSPPSPLLILVTPFPQS